MLSVRGYHGYDINQSYGHVNDHGFLGKGTSYLSVVPDFYGVLLLCNSHLVVTCLALSDTEICEDMASRLLVDSYAGCSHHC